MLNVVVHIVTSGPWGVKFVVSSKPVQKVRCTAATPHVCMPCMSVSADRSASVFRVELHPGCCGDVFLRSVKFCETEAGVSFETLVLVPRIQRCVSFPNLPSYQTARCHDPAVRNVHLTSKGVPRDLFHYCHHLPHNGVCVNRSVHGGGCIMLWWLDFRGEWMGCSRIGWLLCRNGCISECCHEIGLYCVRWSSGRVVLTWGRCWPLHHTGGCSQQDSAKCRLPLRCELKCADMFWLSQRTMIISGRRSSGLLGDVGWQLLADVSGQRICPVFQASNFPLLWIAGPLNTRPRGSPLFEPLEIWKLRPTGWLETSVSTCQPTRRNIPEVRGPKLHGGGSLISGIHCFCFPERPDILWGQSSLIFKAYHGYFPGVSPPGSEVDRWPSSGNE